MCQIISVQPYYKVERIVTSMNQDSVVHQRKLVLYPSKITSAYREFHISEVYDISYKHMGEDQGVLYLHTKQGVFPFLVATEPDDFICEFRKLNEVANEPF